MRPKDLMLMLDASDVQPITDAFMTLPTRNMPTILRAEPILAQDLTLTLLLMQAKLKMLKLLPILAIERILIELPTCR
jgi:hypothetical protein